MNQTAMDFPRNIANIYEAIRKAVEEGSDILALEELALTGYEAGDDFQKTDNNLILAALDDIASYAKALDENLIISIGHPWRLAFKNLPHETDLEFERLKNPLYNRLDQPFNVQSFISGGKILGMTAKSNLFNDERGYEKRYFAEWSVEAANKVGGDHGTIVVKLAADRNEYIPFGRPIIHVSDGKHNVNLAHAICEEKWVASKYDGNPHDDSRYDKDNIIPSISKYLGTSNGLALIVPNASPPSPLKQDKHEHLSRLASKYADVVIDTDGLGSSGSTFAQFGHRFVVQAGKVISKGLRMCFARVACNTTALKINSAPDHTAVLSDASILHRFNNMAVNPDVDPVVPFWDDPANPNREYEEAIRMTALWLFDYMRKVGCTGLAQAQSGGKDSAFNSVIVRAMVELGMNELGVEGFCKEMNLPYSDKVLSALNRGGRNDAVNECMQHMLTAVFMGTRNSSDNTKAAARMLIEGGKDASGVSVEGIGGKYLDINVQDILDFYGMVYAVEDTTALSDKRFNEIRKEVSAFLNLPPGSISPEDLIEKEREIKSRYPEIGSMISAARESDALTYENIQARGRQVLIMAIANMEGKMAIANPNLDEARNAYATFGGDLHSGTINLDAHLPKAFLSRTLKHFYNHGLSEVMKPVRCLWSTLNNKASAELQPKDENGEVVQNDEDALHGTFDQLNAIGDYMLHTKVDENEGARRLNAKEILEHCREDKLFHGLSDEKIYDMLWFRYKRWQVAQHKIHASPVAPTYGKNVDHQSSQRTPNLNGGGYYELVQLGVSMVYDMAKADGVVLRGQDKAVHDRRAWQDEEFLSLFEGNLRNTNDDELDFDINALYGRVLDKGWDAVFPPLSADHPIMIIHKHKSQSVPSLG